MGKVLLFLLVSYLKSLRKTVRRVSLLLPRVKLTPQIVMESTGKRIITFAMRQTHTSNRYGKQSEMYRYFCCMSDSYLKSLWKTMEMYRYFCHASDSHPKLLWKTK